MKEFISYTLNLILAMGLFVMAFRSCKEPKQEVKIVKDDTTINQLNQDYEDLQRMYFNASETHESEIKRFKALKSSIVYKYIPKEKIIHDTLLECCDLIEPANQLIIYSDSLNITLENALISCNGNVEDLKRQLKFNVAYKEIGQYKHLVWKLYFKKK